jgi:hypothetical protein
MPGGTWGGEKGVRGRLDCHTHRRIHWERFELHPRVCLFLSCQVGVRAEPLLLLLLRFSPLHLHLQRG